MLSHMLVTINTSCSNEYENTSNSDIVVWLTQEKHESLVLKVKENIQRLGQTKDKDKRL